MNGPLERLRAGGVLTSQLRDEILASFGERGKKALKAVESGHVRKYLDFVVVVGSSGEHVVDDDFCTCRDFIYRGGQCWHILAAAIADATGAYISVPSWYQENLPL